MRLDECPYFCRVRVTDLGSGASLDDDDMDNVEAFRGEIVVPWTEVKKAGDACVRGVVIPEVGIRQIGCVGGPQFAGYKLSWLAGDAAVELVDPPRYAGPPDELLALDWLDRSLPTPSGGRRRFLDGTQLGNLHPLIYSCRRLFSCVVGPHRIGEQPSVKFDAQDAVEFFLGALDVAPESGDLRPRLLASLRVRYGIVKRKADLYPPALYPWRETAPDVSRPLWRP